MLHTALQTIRRAPIYLRSQRPAAARQLTVTASRATVLPHAPSTFLPPCYQSVSSAPRILVSVRGVASSVSNRPGSQTPEHAATNIKEEVGNAASELAKSIAGANFPIDNVKPINNTFVSIALTPLITRVACVLIALEKVGYHQRGCQFCS